MSENDFFIKTGLELSVRRVGELLSTGVFQAPVLHVFQRSVFTELMIELNDLLQTLDKLGKRIDFAEDIDGDKDITDLVNKLRNAVCHIKSGERLLDKKAQVKVSFCVAVGEVKAISCGGKELKSEYKDDVRFFYGELGIYLRRHIVRALEEAQKAYRELYAEEKKTQPSPK